MIALLVGVGIVVAAVGADLVAARIATHRARSHLEEQLGTDVAISLRGWPRTTRLLLGDGLAATLSATHVPLREADVTLTALAVFLDRVRVERGAAGDPHRLHVSGGRFQARLDAAAVHALTPVPGLREVRIEVDRISYVLPGGVAVTGHLEVDEDGDLVFIPDGGPLGTLQLVRIAAPIGRLPFGATIEEIGTETDAITVDGSVGATTFDLGGPQAR